MSHVDRLTAHQEQLKDLLIGIDQGLEDHLAWNQKLIRCVLLHDAPDEDMLGVNAHHQCRFGQWLAAERPKLGSFDEGSTQAVELNHQRMHDAVRALCEKAVHGLPAHAQDFHAYEAAQIAMVTTLNALRRSIAEVSLNLDELTGLPLRNGLDFAFQIRQKDAVRQSAPLYLAMVDVDHFKVVNDTWGHPVGDQALRHLARLMVSCLRDNDVVVRFGGEEFLFLLLGHDAKIVMERILYEVRTHPMAMPECPSGLSMTITAGLTPVGLMDTLASAVERADQALLLGKHSGRDRCVLAPLPD